MHPFSRTCRLLWADDGSWRSGSSSLSLLQLARILRRRVAVARTALVISVLAHALSLGAWHFVFVGRGMCDVLGIFSLLGCSVGMERTTGDKRNRTFTANSQSRAVKGSQGQSRASEASCRVPLLCIIVPSAWQHGSMAEWQNGRMATSEGYGRTTMTAMMMGVDNP